MSFLGFLTISLLLPLRSAGCLSVPYLHVGSSEFEAGCFLHLRPPDSLRLPVRVHLRPAIPLVSRETSLLFVLTSVPFFFRLHLAGQWLERQYLGLTFTVL